MHVSLNTKNNNGVRQKYVMPYLSTSQYNFVHPASTISSNGAIINVITAMDHTERTISFFT